MFFYGIYSLGYIYIDDGRIQCKYKYFFPPSPKYKASLILRIHNSYTNIRTNDLKICCSTLHKILSYRRRYITKLSQSSKKILFYSSAAYIIFTIPLTIAQLPKTKLYDS